MSDEKNILILGVGRSGTTAIYNLLQDILEQESPDNTDYVYEPFLWDRRVLNKKYTEISSEWENNSSISLEGAYFNKRMPLFYDTTDDDINDKESMKFIDGILTPRNKKKNILVKAIRANGRVPFIRKVSPATKIIFVIRNPLDVINSSINMFSFFGDDFFESDYSRFIEEISDKYSSDEVNSFSQETVEQREFLYWYFMNRAFVENYVNNNVNTLPIVYEEFVSNKDSVIREICEFIGVEVSDDFMGRADKVVGPSFGKKSQLTENGVKYIGEKLPLYTELVNSLGFCFGEDKERALINKYQDKGYSQLKNRQFHHLNSLTARSLLDQKCADYDLLQAKNQKQIEVLFSELQDLKTRAARDSDKFLREKELLLVKWVIEKKGYEAELNVKGKELADKEKEFADKEKGFFEASKAVDDLLSISGKRNPIKKIKAYKNFVSIYNKANQT